MRLRYIALIATIGGLLVMFPGTLIDAPQTEQAGVAAEDVRIHADYPKYFNNTDTVCVEIEPYIKGTNELTVTEVECNFDH